MHALHYEIERKITSLWLANYLINATEQKDTLQSTYIIAWVINIPTVFNYRQLQTEPCAESSTWKTSAVVNHLTSSDVSPCRTCLPLPFSKTQTGLEATESLPVTLFQKSQRLYPVTDNWKTTILNSMAIAPITLGAAKSAQAHNDPQIHHPPLISESDWYLLHYWRTKPERQKPGLPRTKKKYSTGKLFYLLDNPICEWHHSTQNRILHPAQPSLRLAQVIRRNELWNRRIWY